MYKVNLKPVDGIQTGDIFTSGECETKEDVMTEMYAIASGFGVSDENVAAIFDRALPNHVIPALEVNKEETGFTGVLVLITDDETHDEASGLIDEGWTMARMKYGI